MGAILYAGIGRLVYAATIQDSRFAVNEILAPSKDVAKFCVNRKIEIVPELEREKAAKVLREWKSHSRA